MRDVTVFHYRLKKSIIEECVKIASIHISQKSSQFLKNNLEGNVEKDKQNYNNFESMNIKVIAV